MVEIDGKMYTELWKKKKKLREKGWQKNRKFEENREKIKNKSGMNVN